MTLMVSYLSSLQAAVDLLLLCLYLSPRFYFTVDLRDIDAFMIVLLGCIESERMWRITSN